MKRDKKFLGLFLLSVLMVSFLGGVVIADTEVVFDDKGEITSFKTTTSEVVSTLAGSFSSLFGKWKEGALGPNVAKIFFFIMISLLIMLIFGGLFGKKNWIVIILSFIIGFLATAYMTPKDVFSLLNSYTALGLTLTTLVPIMILLGLTYRSATVSEGKVQLIMLQYFAWILFAVYSTYRFIYDWFWAKDGSGFMNGILLATAIGAALVALFNKKIMGILSEKYMESSEQAAQETFTKAGRALKKLKKFEEGAAGTS